MKPGCLFTLSLATLSSIWAPAFAQTSEPNSLPCPAAHKDSYARFVNLVVNEVSKDADSGMAVKLTQIFADPASSSDNSGQRGVVADVLLPTVTLRGMVFQDPRMTYQRPVRSINVCGAKYLIASYWFGTDGNAITIKVLTGAAAGL